MVNIITDVGSMNVKMSLDSAQFTQSMTGINTKLRALRSEMNVARSGGRDFQKSLEGMQQRSGNLAESLDVQRVKVGQLKDEYEESVKTKGKDATETLRLESAYNNATATMNRTEAQLKRLNSEIRLQESPWNKASTAMGNARDKLKLVGDKMGSIGKNMSMKVTTPILAVGAAVFKSSDTIDKAMNNIINKTGATGSAAESLEKSFRKVFQDVPESADDVSNTMANLQVTTDATGKELENLTKKTLLYAKVNKVDAAESADRLGVLMNALEVDISAMPFVMDKLTKAAQMSGIGVNDLIGHVIDAGPAFEEMGFSLDRSIALFANFHKAGADPREVLSSLNIVLNRMAKDGATNAEEAFNSLLGQIEDAPDILSATTIASEAFGAKVGAKVAEDIRAGAFEVEEWTEVLEQAEGTLDRTAAETETFGDRIGKLRNKATLAFEPFGKTLTDTMDGALDSMEPIIATMQGMAESFNDLSPKTKTMIISLAGIAAATGPVLYVGSKLVAVIGAIAGIISAVTGAIAVVTTGAAAATPAIGGLAAAFTVLTGPVGLIVAGLAVVAAGAFFAIKKGSEDAIEPVKRFGEEVSEATQEAVGAYMDLSEKADTALKELAWSQAQITEEMAEDMVEQQTEITDSLMDAIDERHKRELEVTKEQFDNLEGLSEETRKDILDKTNEHFESEKAVTEEANKKINEIYEQAAEEKRAITEKESDEILSIREDMTGQAVVMMSENEVEQKVILEKMMDNASTITALEAAEVVRNSKQKKEDVIADANEQFDETYAWAIRQRDELGAMSAKEADEVIAEARRQRDGAVENAEGMHESVVSEAKQQADEHVNHVDWETGEVLSKWKVFKNKMATKTEEIYKSVSDKTKKLWKEASKHFNNLYQDITGDTKTIETRVSEYFERTKRNSIKAFNELKEGATKAIGTVVNTVSTMPGKVVEFAPRMVTAGRDLIGGLITGLLAKAREAYEAVAGVARGIVARAKNVFQSKSDSRVFIAIGRDVTGGLATGLRKGKGETDKHTQRMVDSIIQISENMHEEIAYATKKADADKKEAEQKSIDSIKKIQAKARKDRRSLTTAESQEIRKSKQDLNKKLINLDESLSNDIIKIKEDHQKQADARQKAEFDSSKKWIDERKYYNELSLKEELAAWERVQSRYRGFMEERKEADRQVYRVKQELMKAEFNHSKKWIDDRKYYNELSLADEISAWERVQARYMKGTEERKEADRSLYALKKQLHEKIKAINEDYIKDMENVKNELIKSEQAINQAYDDAVANRTQSLTSFMGIFDEMKEATEVSGQMLIDNLAGQVTALDNWATDIELLAKKGIDKGLLDELRVLGPKAAAEIQALNTLSGPELIKYTELWKEKGEIARSQAVKELEGMKDDSQKQIIELRKVADKELTKLEHAWMRKIKEIRYGTKDEMDYLESDMTGIGKNAMKGLISGLISMEGTLMGRVRSITDSIKRSIADAFQIQSDSKWMRDFIGKNMMSGWASGIDAEKISTIRKANELSGWMKPIVPISNGLQDHRVGGSDKVGNKITNDNRNVDITVDAGNIKEVEKIIRLFSGLKQAQRSQ